MKFKPPKPKPPLEAKEEADFMRDLKKSGVEFKIRKMNGLGYRSWPDRLVLGPKRFMVWIELKRKVTGRLSEGQKELFDELDAMDHKVHVFDDGHRAADFVLGLYKEHMK